MPYSVNNTDSSLNFTVQDGAIDSSTLSVALIGTNAENYGDDIARNDIHLLENFASISKPSAGTVLTGQLWYDKTDKVLRIYKGADVNDWVNLETLVSATAPTRLTPRIGEEYFDTSNNKGYIYNGASWKATGYAGEETSAFSGDSLVHNPTKFGSKVRALFLKDTSGRVHPCMGLVYVNNSTTNELYGSSTNGETLMAIFNHDAQFTVDNVLSTSEGDSINYYAELNATGGIGVIINKGMNLRSDYIAEAVALATEAVQAQKANALVVGGSVVSATNFLRNSADILPSADITFSIGSPTHRYDHLYIQQITLGAGQEQLQFVSNNNAVIGSSSRRAKDIWTYDLHASANVNVGEILSVTGNSNLTGNVDITNNLQVNQNIRGNAFVRAATFQHNTHDFTINSGAITGAQDITSNGTITFASISDGGITITAFVDEDGMTSDSATLLPTQQSVKTYVDTEVATLKSYVEAQDKLQDLDFGGDTGTGAVIIGNATVDSASMTFTGGDGITTTASGTTITTDVDNTVVRTSGTQTIGGVKTFTNNANFGQNVVITGNLNVNGTQTTVDTATLSVADNEITLNSDVTGSPSENAGIEVERGTSTNVRLRWNESTNSWTYTNDGSAYKNLISLDSLTVTTASASGGGALSYNTTTGTFTFTPPATFSTNIAASNTDSLSEGSSNLYFTNARADARVGAYTGSLSTSLDKLSNVSSTAPSSGQFLKWTGSTWEPATSAAGVEGLLDLNDVGTDGTNGQVLKTDGSGNFTFGSVSSSNNYADSLAFNTTDGILTVGRNGLGNLTVDLDGRFGAGTSNFDGVYSSLTSKPTIYAEPGIFSGAGTPSLATGVTGAEIRSLIGAGTSSVDDTGTPAILSNGSVPSLNTGITAAEIRSLIGAGTSGSDTTYTAGGGLTLTGSEFTLTPVTEANNVAAVARRYINSLTLDTYGRVTGVGTASEGDQSFDDTNDYVNSAAWNSTNGKITLTRTDGGTIVVDIDGRYSTSDTTYSTATSSTLGLVKIGYSESGKNYPVELSSGQMYVNVPWTDTVTTNTDTLPAAGTGVSVSGATVSIGQAVATSSTVQFALIRSTGDVVAYYSSDERLKDNVKPIENALEKLQKIRGVEFDWNDKQDVYQGHDTGVIAQEVQKVLPEVVTEREDGYLAVKYEKMIGLLVESIKDLKAEVDELKTQLNEK